MKDTNNSYKGTINYSFSGEPTELTEGQHLECTITSDKPVSIATSISEDNEHYRVGERTAESTFTFTKLDKFYKIIVEIAELSSEEDGQIEIDLVTKIV
jgi:hypothetical protein